MSLYLKKNVKTVSNSRCNIENSGSTETQVTILTSRINRLQLHFMEHKKDRHSRRGLLRIVSRRRKLLKYLKNKNKTSYNDLVDHLGLRH